MPDVERYITDEAVEAVCATYTTLNGRPRQGRVILRAALPAILAQHRRDIRVEVLRGAAADLFDRGHASAAAWLDEWADKLLWADEAVPRDCFCPMPNRDCQHPSCPRDPEVQAIERRMADEAVADD